MQSCYHEIRYTPLLHQHSLPAVKMPPNEEDLAWIRSSFHPVPRPQLPDDCVEYSLYVISPDLDPPNDPETRLHLREVQKAASDLQKTWLKDYIWQRQGFGLEVVREDGEVCHTEDEQPRPD